MGCKRFNRGVSVEKNSAVPLKKRNGHARSPGIFGIAEIFYDLRKTEEKIEKSKSLVVTQKTGKSNKKSFLLYLLFCVYTTIFFEDNSADSILFILILLNTY